MGCMKQYLIGVLEEIGSMCKHLYPVDVWDIYEDAGADSNIPDPYHFTLLVVLYIESMYGNEPLEEFIRKELARCYTC